MNWHHGIPNACLVFLLLLSFSTSSEPSNGCIFKGVPIDTRNFSHIVENLKLYLLLDYPISVPVDLKPDQYCMELWKVHLINRNLKSMINVSGSRLKELIMNIMDHTTFVEKCNINDSCVNFTMTNISEFLEPIPSLLAALRNKMEVLIDEEPGDFRNCTVIHCQSDPHPTPAPQITAPEQITSQHSPHASAGNLHLVLLVISVPLLVVFIIWICLCRKPCQRSQRYDETELEPMENF